MMKYEFEQIAGYEVSDKDYNEIIEPMYMATNLDKVEFVKKNQGNRIVCMIGGHHVTCIIEGKVNDIWDCTNKCIGNYWIKG